MSERFKHIPGRNGGKEDYPRKYSVENDRAYKSNKLWENSTFERNKKAKQQSE